MPFLTQKASSDIPININIYEQFYDGTLRTDDGTTFQINKALLAQRSDYFRALFCFEGKNTTDILVKEIGSETLRQILHYLYEGAMHINEKNVCDLMIASDYMVLDDLTEECREFAFRNMTSGSCIPFLTIAAGNEGSQIFRECSRYAKVHFEEIVKSFSDQIEDLPLEVLSQLLKDNALNVSSEYTVWMAIAIWVKKDPFNRNRHVPGLLSCIRYEDIDGLLWWWCKMVQDPTVMPNPVRIEVNSLQVAHPPKIYGPLFLQKNQYRETVPRLPKYLHVVVSCGISQFGMDSGQILNSEQMHLTYDEELDFWRKIQFSVPIPVPRAQTFPDAIVPFGKYIYFCYRKKCAVLRYDLLDDLFIPLTGVLAYRVLYCFVELNQKIYALGTFTMLDDVNTMQCYNPKKDRWNTITFMGRMIISDAVAMHGKIYVLGHAENGDNAIMVTRVYDPFTHSWNTMEPPKVLRKEFSAVAFENHLYLIGGINPHRLKNAEEYDPVLDVWTSLPDLPFLYIRPKAVVGVGRMMVFDNYDGDRRFIKVSPPVHWDGASRTWQVIDKSFAFSRIERYRFGILDDPIVIRELVNRGRRTAVQWDRAFSSNQN